ncbi:unnamed protein product [Closterium sp. Naga37s-1]|nr:unnamed protein product [Closterium sp. Naga37s-1]
MLPRPLLTAATMVAAHGYPAYRCFKAMQRRRVDLHELLFFCQFWVLLSLLALLEGLASPLLDWVPLYQEAKLAFIVYLWHPRTQLPCVPLVMPSFPPCSLCPLTLPFHHRAHFQGTEIVYGSMLQPLLSRYEPIIDRHLAHLEDRGRDMAVDCWRAGVAYTGARFEELIAYLASLSAQAAASAAMRGLEGSERREERERRERQVEVLRSEKGDGAERRKVGDEQQEEVRGRRKYLQKYGGEAVQLRSVAGDGGVQRPGYERRLLGDEAEGDGRRAEVEEQRVQQGSVQRQAVRYRNVDSDSDGDGGESDGASGGSGASSEFEMVDAEREFSTGSAADERVAAGTAASAGGAGSGGTGRGGGSGWWGSKQLAAGLAGLGRALSPSNSQARQAAAPPPAMLHGALPPAALLPAGVASGLDDVAPDQVDDVAAATVVGEASPHPSGINLRPRRSQRPKKQF